MLGDPRNRLIIHRNARVLLIDSATTTTFFELRRQVLGNGSIERVYQNATFKTATAKTEFGNAGALNLHLGADCVLSPGEGANYGTLRILSSTLTSDAASTIRLKVSTKTNDVINLDGRAEHTLNGRLELLSQNRLPLSTVIPIMVGEKRITALNLNFSHVTPGFRIQKQQLEDGSWVVNTISYEPTFINLY